MYCIECGKQLREGARFCAYCGTDQGAENPPAAAPAHGAGPVSRTPVRASAPAAGEMRPVRPARGRKKGRAGVIVALVLVLAILAGAGYLVYDKVIFPKNVVKDAELLVSFLQSSPQRDTAEDFRLRADFSGHHYYEIMENPEARLKVKDYLRSLYQQGNYGAWVHCMSILQDCSLFYAKDDTDYAIDRADVEDLYNSAGAVNLNGGWYSESGNRWAVLDEYPGFNDEGNFELFTWGDYFAAHSFEYGWKLFYRGWELKQIEPARWSSTSADHMRYVLQNARTYGSLLILPYDDDIFYDAFLVLNTETGESFQVYYDF